MMILKISARNLMRHKGKTFVVGVILFIGSIIMMIGGATITSMEKNVTGIMPDRFLGDITLMSKKNKSEAILENMMGEPIPLIDNFLKVTEILDGINGIDAYLPYCYNVLMLLAGNDNPTGYPAMSAVFAADIPSYQKMFNNIKPLEGKIPVDNEPGILINTYMRNNFYLLNNDIYYPKDTAFDPTHFPSGVTNIKKDEVDLKHNIILMGFSQNNSTSDVKIPVRAVFEWEKLQSFFMELSLIDIGSYRKCMNYTHNAGVVKLDKEEQKILNISFDDPDAMFHDTLIDDNKPESAEILSAKSLFQDSDAGKKETAQTDSGTWELIAVRLKEEDKVNRMRIIDRLNKDLKEAGISVKAVPWENTAGGMMGFLYGIRTGLYILVFLVFVVAIIIIMNSLAMSILERSSELGMIRAVGGKRIFIIKMLLGETFILSAVAGGIGITAGIFLTILIKNLQIPVDNMMLQIITGGPVYDPVLSAADIFGGIIMLTVVTFLSVIYPVMVSMRIGPLDAASRD